MTLLPFESGPANWTEAGFSITTDRGRMDGAELLSALRAEAYWAADLEPGRLERALRSSLPFTARAADGALAGFCRVVTDGASFAYLRDVLVLAAHRGRGLGLALSRCALAHPDLSHVPYWLLRTHDAHGVYEKLGFGALPDPETFMIRRTETVPWPETQEP